MKTITALTPFNITIEVSEVESGLRRLKVTQEDYDIEPKCRTVTEIEGLYTQKQCRQLAKVLLEASK